MQALWRGKQARDKYEKMLEELESREVNDTAVSSSVLLDSQGLPPCC
jgi:hypothetical protein